MKLFKKQIRFIGYMECPEWLGRLIERHAKQMDNYYLPKWWKVFYYEKKNKFWDPYEENEIQVVKNYDEAKKIVKLEKYEIMKENFEKMDIDIDGEYKDLPWKFEKLQQENEELKNLPPVEVERIDADIYPASDPRSKFHNDWKKANIKKK